jgi:hypothetical protein
VVRPRVHRTFRLRRKAPSFAHLAMGKKRIRFSCQSLPSGATVSQFKATAGRDKVAKFGLCSDRHNLTGTLNLDLVLTASG